MANSDYTQRTTGAFCTVAKLTTPLQPSSTQMAVTDLRTVDGEPAAVGSLVYLDDEFVELTSISGSLWGIKRGCLDTLPVAHSSGVSVFVIGTRVASDLTEYLPTATISLKLLTRTTSGVVPIEYAPPNQLTFNSRFARPYPPGLFRANGQHWTSAPLIDGTTSLNLTWVGRNR